MKMIFCIAVLFPLIEVGSAYAKANELGVENAGLAAFEYGILSGMVDFTGTAISKDAKRTTPLATQNIPTSANRNEAVKVNSRNQGRSETTNEVNVDSGGDNDGPSFEQTVSYIQGLLSDATIATARLVSQEASRLHLESQVGNVDIKTVIDLSKTVSVFSKEKNGAYIVHLEGPGVASRAGDGTPSDALNIFVNSEDTARRLVNAFRHLRSVSPTDPFDK